MSYRYAYQNSGGPMLSWKRNPPRQSKPASTALGSLGDPTIVLPRPGAPEPINGSYVAMGCGSCAGGGGMGGEILLGETISALPTSVKVGGALAIAYLLHKHLKKKR